MNLHNQMDSPDFPDNPTEYEKKNNKSYWSPENITAMQKIYSPQEDLLPVTSCFNGLAIYKKYLFDDCSYDSIYEDCEHVFLHQCMIDKYKARIFMNPAQIIRYNHYRK